MTTTIGGWTLHEELGRGGMGVVHRATDASGRVAAIKMLDSPLPDPAAHARFAREVRVLERLDHPGIVRILDSGVDETGGLPRPWLAMGFVEGRTLDHAATPAPDGWRATLERLAAIAEALAHAHAAGVVHRDLKPSNVIVRPDGTPCVLDFGVALWTDTDERIETRATRTGMLVGTVQWMSPEQVLGLPSEVGPATDVHALGLLAHHLLTGTAPWSGSTDSLPDAIVAIAKERPRPLRNGRPELSRELDDLVGAMLAKSPDHRPTAAEVASELRRIASGRRTRRTLRAWTHRAAWTAAVIAAITLAIGRTAADRVDGALLTHDDYLARRALDVADRVERALATNAPANAREALLDECARLLARTSAMPTSPVRQGVRALLYRAQWRVLPEPRNPDGIWNHYMLRTQWSGLVLHEIPEHVERLRPHDPHWTRTFGALPPSVLWEDMVRTHESPYGLDLTSVVQSNSYPLARVALRLWSVERGHPDEPLDSLWSAVAADTLPRPDLWLHFLAIGTDLADLRGATRFDTLSLLVSWLGTHPSVRNNRARFAEVRYHAARLERLRTGARLPPMSADAPLEAALSDARAARSTRIAREILLELAHRRIARAKDASERTRARIATLDRLAEAATWPAETLVDTGPLHLRVEQVRLENDLADETGDDTWRARALADAERGLEEARREWVNVRLPLEIEHTRARLARYEATGAPELRSPIEASLRRAGLAAFPWASEHTQRRVRALQARYDAALRRHGVRAL